MTKSPEGKKKWTERGIILISVYWMLLVLLLLSGTLVSQAIAESRAVQRSQAFFQALYLAEAGIDDAIVQLRQDYNWTAGYKDLPLGTAGVYSVSVSVLPSGRRRLSADGESNFFSVPMRRSIEAILQKVIPPGFYDNIIWASQNVDFNGTSYSVTGDVIHGDASPSGNLSAVVGTVTYDPSVNPLPRLDFEDLYGWAQAQGNVYDDARLGNGHGVFPTSFWYRQPGANGPDDPGEPNVHYITTDLILNGNIGVIGGFFVVVGDVLTDPFVTEDTRINGNGQIQGAIYTTGDFRINGGGRGLNIDGGIWAGDKARLNGSTALTYNATYMNAIRDIIAPNPDVQVVSWRNTSRYGGSKVQ